MLKSLAMAFGLWGLLACGNKDFKRNPPTQLQNVPEPVYQSPAPSEPSEVPVVASAPESSALHECLKQWTNPPHPFTPEEIRQPQVVTLKQSSQNNELLYSDTTATDREKLYLINFDISIGNQSSIALKNPKGWYCLNVTAKVINNFRIQLACKSQLAIISKSAQNDNKFQIEREACPF